MYCEMHGKKGLNRGESDDDARREREDGKMCGWYYVNLMGGVLRLHGHLMIFQQNLHFPLAI